MASREQAYLTREMRSAIRLSSTSLVKEGTTYGYHFILLHELRYGMELPAPQKLSIPYFLLQSLIDSNSKLKAGVPDQLVHHRLIKLLVEEALHTFTIPIA